MNLISLGWNAAFQNAFDNLKNPDWMPAKVFSEDRGSYLIMTELGEFRGKTSGSYRHVSKNRADFPAVGDWLAVQLCSGGGAAIIHALLPRINMLSRKIADDSTEKQVLAANVDYVFIVSGLDHNFNLRRIERYIALAWDGGVQPVIVLNKVDLIADKTELNKIKNAIESVALDVPVHFISLVSHKGLAELSSYFTDHKTVVLVGSSGVGKSTLTNYLIGEDLQKTASTRASDSRGRHVTTRRQLFPLASGGMLIDTPGIRELQLWADKSSLDTGFSDIEDIAKSCRFNDCKHSGDPGCAVQEAIMQNKLEAKRLVNYLKLQQELKQRADRQWKTPWRSI
ncbi:MAG: ribosome small subunit-dependent GTPase A [Gammaproteobacteria bacterium GWE2_37_16]|nr:MAG: ribosome small subunit-dependent GTPase A [Gammaproteobacteria bacterium GWE2_37_16]